MSITNYDGRLEAMAGYCESMYELLAKINNAYYDSVETVYSKSLPTKYVDVLGIKKIGGQAVVWNQLVDTGTATVDTVTGHKYYTLINGTASIITSDGTAVTVLDDAADMVCDLTVMFGKGKEPATTSAFTAIFTAEHYDYNEGTLLTAGVTSVVSKDSNDTEIANYPIPAAVQALEGYGISGRGKEGPVVYNYVDFDKKTFVHNLAFIDLGSLNWTYSAANGYFQADVSINVPVTSQWDVPKGICSRYNPAQMFYVANPNDGIDKSIGWYSNMIRVRDSAYGSDATAFTNSLDGVYLWYELKTPVETDISDLLTDIIPEAEKSGTLTFENQHGDDYRIPVPVELEYIGV